MDYNEYKALRRSLFGNESDIGQGAPASSIAWEIRRRLNNPPAPSFDLDYMGYNGGARYRVTGEGIPADVSVVLTVEQDSYADLIEDQVTGAGFEWTPAGYSDPTDEDQQERPHHSAVAVDTGGRGRSTYVWISFTDTIKAPAGMAKGPAEEYRRRKAREYAQAQADYVARWCNDLTTDYAVSATIEVDGEEVWSDSLCGIGADSDEEAARYYWSEYGQGEAADALADARKAAARMMMKKAATLAEKAAALLA